MADPSTAAHESFLGAPPAEVAGLNHRSKARDKASARASVAGAAHDGASSNELGTPSTVTSEDDATTEEPKKGRKRLPEPLLWVIDIVVWVVGAILLSTLLRMFVFQMFLVPSDSMENTLIQNDRIASLKVTHFQRGDIVVFADPGGWLSEPAEQISPVHKFFETIGLLASTDQQYLVKRAIGLPGDRVQCCTADGKIIVNGVPIDESMYLMDPSKPASGITFDVTVPEGRICVMGDNRYNSADSRYHLCQQTDDGLGMNAFVPEGNIVGPVRAVVLPLGRTGRRPLPVTVFQNVPAPTSPAPAAPSISVTGGLPQTCQR